MGKREVETQDQRQIADERDEPEQLAEKIAVVELAHAQDRDEKTDADIDEREGEGFYRAAQISELAPLGEKEAVEKHFEHEQGDQNADLQREAASGGPARGPLEPVAAAEFVAFELEVAQMPAQAVQFVPALGGFGAKFAHGSRRGLPYRPEAAFEVETRQPFLVGAQLVEQRAVGGVLLRFHAFHDPDFDIVEGDP